MATVRTPRPVSVRELEVLDLVQRGMTNAEIADVLGISSRTVKAHCDSLRIKLGVEHKRELSHAARMQGVLV